MTDRNPTLAFFALLAVAVFALTGSALAGGFYSTEIGTPSSMGTSGAGNVTQYRGPDAAWSNPAGMVGIDRSTTYFGTQGVIPNVKFESSFAEDADGPIPGNDGGQAGQFAVIPSFFWVKPLSDDWRFGVALTAPFGGGFNFSNRFVGRYSVQALSLTGLGLSPSFAYRVNDRVSVGGGVSIVASVFEEDIKVKREDLGGNPLPDGEAQIRDADDVGAQPFAGLQWQYSDNGRFGVVYRAEMDVKLEGDIKIIGLPTPIDTDLKLGWDNPQMLEVGIRQRVSDRWTIVANADWEDWSAFSQNVLRVQGPSDDPVVVPIDRKWDDTFKVGVGAIRHVGDRLLSFGAAYDDSPVEDEDRTLDLPIDEQLRLSCAWGRERPDKLSWALGGTALWMGDGKVDQTSQGVRLIGEFDKNWIFFVGGTLRKVF